MTAVMHACLLKLGMITEKLQCGIRCLLGCCLMLQDKFSSKIFEPFMHAMCFLFIFLVLTFLFRFHLEGTISTAVCIGIFMWGKHILFCWNTLLSHKFIHREETLY